MTPLLLRVGLKAFELLRKGSQLFRTFNGSKDMHSRLHVLSAHDEAPKETAVYVGLLYVCTNVHCTGGSGGGGNICGVNNELVTQT
jgi:hypothetical protein